MFSTKSGEVWKPPKPPLLGHHLGAPGYVGRILRGKIKLTNLASQQLVLFFSPILAVS